MAGLLSLAYTPFYSDCFSRASLFTDKTNCQEGTQCICYVGAHGSYNELADLCCTDVSFCISYMEVKIHSSKTDLHSPSNSVLVSRSAKCTHPVRMLEKYKLMGGLSQ